MKAAAIKRHGDVDVIGIQDLPAPSPGPGEVVLDVRAAALNHLDIWVRKGGRIEIPLPHVLGSDAAGVVSAVGEGVETPAEGDEVVLNPGLSCMRCDRCLAGEHSLCESYGIVGFMRWGTFAEKVAVPAVCCRPKPSHLDWSAAAALPLDHLTAWRMLFTRARLQPGETVLIHGIGGGAALAGLQLAALAGAEVIATSSSNDKLSRAIDLGAAHTINYTDADVAAVARDLTGGRGVDVVFDAVGAATWPINFAAVRRGGRIVHCGVTTGASAEVSIQQLYWNQISVMGSTMGSQSEFTRMLEAIGAAELSPVIDTTGPLEQINHLTGRMEAGQQFGKLVLTVGT